MKPKRRRSELVQERPQEYRRSLMENQMEKLRLMMEMKLEHQTPPGKEMVAM